MQETTIGRSPSNGEEQVSRVGIVRTWTELGLGMMESGVRSSFSIGHEVRAEMAKRILGAVELGDAIQQSLMRLGRSMVSGVDGLVDDAMRRSEIGWLATLQAFRSATDGAHDLAARSASAFVGQDRAPAAVSADA